MHEFKFFFFAWWEVKEYSLEDDELVITQETKKYFIELEESE
jgi:hypothetical protein